MTALGYGLLFARRRWVLALVAVLGVLIPVGGGAIALIVDYSSRSTGAQAVADRLGTASGILTPDNGLGTAADRNRVAQQVSAAAGGAPLEPILTAFDVPVKMNGITQGMSMLERDWTHTFAGLMVMSLGHQPEHPGEVVITPAIAKSDQLNVGDTLALSVDHIKPLIVVGVGVLPLSAGDAQVVFTAPGTIGPEDLHVVRAEWLVRSSLTVRQVSDLTELGILVRDRQTIDQAPASFYAREPIVFGGVAFIAVISVMLALRYLTSRAHRGTQSVLNSLGADRKFVAAVALSESGLCALLGAAIVAIIVFVLGPLLSRQTAEQVQHLSPGLAPIVPSLIIALALAVVCVTAASLIEILPQSKPRFRKAIATAGVKSVWTPKPGRLGPVTLGRILARTYLRRTAVLGLLAIVLAGSATTVYSVITSVNNAANANAQPLWRPTDITLAVDGVLPPNYLVTELSQLVGGNSVVLSKLRDPQDLSGLASIGMVGSGAEKGWCSLIIVDSPAEWGILTEAVKSSVMQDELATGSAAILNPACTSANAQLETAPGDNPVRTYGTVRPHRSKQVDRFTLRIADAAISNATAARLKLASTPALLIARGNTSLDQATRDQAARLVEAAGYSATSLRQGTVAPVGTPPTLVVLMVGLFILLLVGGGTAVVAIAMDDARTHRLLDGIGMGPVQRTVVLARTAIAPILGCGAIGVVLGLGGATWWCLDQGISLSIPAAVVGGAFALLVVSQTAAGVIALGRPIR